MAKCMKLLILEFNELCHETIQALMAAGSLPNFKRLYERSTSFITQAGESPPDLEPWIQWPTIHSGMTLAEHGVRELGDGDLQPNKYVAEILSNNGITVGVFGSMNLNYRNISGYLLPDPWSRNGSTVPASLQPYYDLVSRQVQESSKSDAMSVADAARMAWFLLTHGLSPATVRFTLSHLYDEFIDKGVTWRRASVLDHFQYDVFRHYNKRCNAQFATFFCNSTAHFQHYYWRNMQPELFSVAPAASDHPSLADAIPYGYRSMDRLVGRSLQDYPDATIVLATGLSQCPWTDTTKCTYRPRDFQQLLLFAQIDPKGVAISPVMAEQFHIDFTSTEECSKALAALQDLLYEDRPAFMLRRDGPCSIFCGAQIFEQAPMSATVQRLSDGQSMSFHNLFYMIHSIRSGHHDPRGLLWIGNGKQQVAAQPVPITNIAPTILKFFGIEQPVYMRGEPLI
jgi:hypothetical protein